MQTSEVLETSEVFDIDFAEIWFHQPRHISFAFDPSVLSNVFTARRPRQSPYVACSLAVRL